MNHPIIQNTENKISPFLVNSSGFKNTQTLIENLGGDFNAICSMAGIPHLLQVNNNGPLTINYASSLYEFCARNLKADNFGLQLSMNESLTPMRLPIDYLRASRTLADFLRDFCRYSEEYFTGVVFYFHQSKSICNLGCEIVFPLRNGHLQIIEYIFGLLCNEIASLCAPYVRPLQSVHLRHKPPIDKSLHTKTFGVRVNYNQNANMLVFGNDVSDRVLNNYSVQQQARIRQTIESERLRWQPCIITRVIQSICLKTFHRRQDACQVAASLALSERTLQRRLADEGTSYLKVTEYFYGNLALQYLQQSTLTVAEIAAVLEYADQHSFSKAFRKWYGITPATVRRLRKANAGAALPFT